MDSDKIRKHLVSAGVKNLKVYGYPAVTSENILTDRLYSAFFETMLKDNVGHSAGVDLVIAQLLTEIHKDDP